MVISWHLHFHGHNPQLANVVTEVLEHIKNLPRYLIPSYFDAVISMIHHELTTAAFSHMSE